MFWIWMDCEVGQVGGWLHWQSPGKMQTTPRSLSAWHAFTSTNKEKRENSDLRIFIFSFSLPFFKVVSCLICFRERHYLKYLLKRLKSKTIKRDPIFPLFSLFWTKLHVAQWRRWEIFCHLAGTIPRSQWRCLCHHLHRSSRSNWAGGRKERRFYTELEATPLVWGVWGGWASVKCQQFLIMQSTSGNCIKL